MWHGKRSRWGGADWAAGRKEGTRLAAECFAHRAQTSADAADYWDAGHYLLDAGAADAAFGFLGLFGQHFLDQGRGLSALELLGRFADGQGRPRLADQHGGAWWGLFGETVAMLGDLAGALGAYRESLAVSQRLAAADPSNAGWQRDLSVSQEKLGDVLRAQGDLAGALGAYRESLAVSQRLAAADPSNAGWQRDLSVSYWRMAIMAEKAGTGDAAAWWRLAYETLSALQQRGIMLPTDEPYLEQLRQQTGSQ